MSSQVSIKKSDLEYHREYWANVAKDYGWYVDPFFVQLWVNSDGDISDSVSYRNLDRDLFLDSQLDEPISVNIH
jgi:hypothetical protein